MTPPFVRRPLLARVCVGPPLSVLTRRAAPLSSPVPVSFIRGGPRPARPRPRARRGPPRRRAPKAGAPQPRVPRSLRRPRARATPGVRGRRRRSRRGRRPSRSRRRPPGVLDPASARASPAAAPQTRRRAGPLLDLFGRRPPARAASFRGEGAGSERGPPASRPERYGHVLRVSPDPPLPTLIPCGGRASTVLGLLDTG